MAIDLFATRTMLAAMEVMKPPRSFLLDTFFGTREQSNTEYVDIDVYKGKRRMAPFVKHNTEAKLVDRIGYSTNTYKPAYIKMKMPTTAQDILKRQRGDTIYQGNASPAARAAAQLGKDMTELMQMIHRREEWMAAQLLNTGSVSIVGDGVNDTIDFGMQSSHKVTLTGTALWTDAASKPLDNFRTWRSLVAQDSGLVPNIAILGSDVATAFINNTQVKAMMDLLRHQQGSVDVGAMNAQGVTHLASLFNGALQVVTYEDWYFDGSVEQPFVPADKIFLGSTSARTARHYGAIHDLDVTAAVPYFPKSWVIEDPSARMLMVQSAPLVAMHEVDGFMSIKAV